MSSPHAQPVSSPEDAAVTTPLAPYDGILLLSFGGPEGHDEVLPFLQRVTAGRGIPDARLAEVAQHYHSRDGISPINAQNRRLVAALEAALGARGIDVPVRLGNRNSAPFLVDALRELHAAGARHLLTVLTSAYSSYSSCRQYRENLADAVAELAPDVGGELQIDKVAPWYGLPGFVQGFADGVAQALRGSDEDSRSEDRGSSRDWPAVRVLHVTHSIPEAMAAASGPPELRGVYVDQHERVAAVVDDLVEQALGRRVPSELVYCSRSGPPHQPWLEPDVSDRIRELAAEGVRRVVVVPIGFVSDHMEVISDLDDDAVDAGRETRVEVVRVRTPGADQALVDDLVDLMLARASQARGERPPAAPGWVVPGDRRPAVCASGCCANLRGPRPALCGSE